MRVAFNAASESLISQLGHLQEQQSRLQRQAATGLRISQLGDDPAAMSRVYADQADSSRASQYRSNIAALQDRASTSYSSISGLQTVIKRAGEIATLADGLSSPEEMQAYAVEVEQLIERGVQLANSTFRGEYLFGGTSNQQPPFVTTADANGRVSAVSYQGNESMQSVEISEGTMLTVQVPGENTTGSGPTGLISDSRNGADLFAHLISLRDHLISGDTAAITNTDMAALVKDEDNITLHAGANGFAQSELEVADAFAATQTSSAAERISRDASADLAQTLSSLSASQTAYQAALQSGAALLGQSQTLLDYLR